MSSFKKRYLTPEDLEKVPAEVKPEKPPEPKYKIKKPPVQSPSAKPVQTPPAKPERQEDETEIKQGAEESGDEEDMQNNPTDYRNSDPPTPDGDSRDSPGADVVGIDFNEWYIPQGEPTWINY